MESEMRCCNMDGSEDQLLFTKDDESFDNGDSFVIFDGKIYYSDETAVYAYDIAKAANERLCGGPDPVGLAIYGRTLYFGSEDGLYAYSLNSGDLDTIIREKVDRNYTFYDGRFFFVREFAEEDREELVDYLADDDYSNRLIYTIALISVGEPCSVDMEGNEKPVEVECENSLCASLYATPEGIYKETTVLSSPELLEIE